MTVLKDIAEGDLTKEIALSSHDEVGELARYLNFTVEKIKRLVLSIRKETDILSQTGSELAANMNETASSINEIAATIQSIKAQPADSSPASKEPGSLWNRWWQTSRPSTAAYRNKATA